MRPWVDKIVYPEHEARCQESGLDPAVAKGIVNIDCYPEHISKEFRAWMKAKYSILCLVYVPPKCTSKAQIVDVMLNKPFKNYYCSKRKPSSNVCPTLATTTKFVIFLVLF